MSQKLISEPVKESGKIDDGEEFSQKLDEKQIGQFSKKKMSIHRGKARLRCQEWEIDEVKKIFRLYEEIGPIWKKIGERFSNRSSNSIKNRFYTTLRHLLKKLFRLHPKIQTIPHQISSKVLLRFYMGRQEFVLMKNFAKQLLEKMDYGEDQVQAKKLVLFHEQEIKKLYDLIFSHKSLKNVNETKRMKNDRISQPIKSQTHVLKQEHIFEERPIKEEGQNLIYSGINPFQIQQAYIPINAVVPNLTQYASFPYAWAIPGPYTFMI